MTTFQDDYPERRTNQERSRKTRALLIDAARQLFERHGYEDTATEQVVQQAGVTRGALYHHFRDKKDLFRAVIEEIEKEVAAGAAQAWKTGTDPWSRFTAGQLHFFEATSSATVRLLLVEGPAVLGYQEWRKLDEAIHLKPATRAVEHAIAQGKLVTEDPEKLARVMIAVVNALGTTLVETEDLTSDDIILMWQQMLSGFEVD